MLVVHGFVVITIALATALSCFILIEILERLAPSAGLVDKPCQRKAHIGEVPLVGGIAIFASLVFAFFLVDEIVFLPPTLLVIAGLLVLLGIIDDIYNLSALLRLFVQIALAAAMVHFGNIQIQSVGAIAGGVSLEMPGPVAAVFTVICTVGVINAINMIDGLDGLAGSLLLISFGTLAALAITTASPHATALVCISAAIAVFLCYNNRWVRPRARIFLGDSGSMFLGLMLVWYFVTLSQGNTPSLHPVSAGWILGLPLIETISVLVARMVTGISPFSAGRDHLHHRLLSVGLGTNGAVGLMVGIHAMLAYVGYTYASHAEAEPYLFWIFAALILANFVLCRNLHVLNRRAITEQ